MIKKWQIILIWTLAACALLVAGTALAESTLTLPEDVTVIEEQAFWGTDAETIVVPAGVTSIGDGAFGGSARLHVVYVPDSLMDRETAALQGSPNARFVSRLRTGVRSLTTASQTAASPSQNTREATRPSSSHPALRACR